jgi:hypothetical protein
MKDKIIFDFQNPVKVQFKDGEKNCFIDLDKIYLSAPSYKDKDKTLVLKKKFIEAIFGMTQSLSKQQASEQIDNKDNEEPLDAKKIKTILYASPNFDIVGYFKSFANLLLNVAFKDEEMKQPLNNLDIEKINEEDFEELLAKYLEVFFIVSWMKTLK